MHGRSFPNYYYEDLVRLNEIYMQSGLANPAVIVDVNHANSGKQHLEQARIAEQILQSRRQNGDIQRLVKGLMIESYLEDGAQESTSAEVYGKSITDPCLGWEKTEDLILRIRESL